MVLSYRRSDGEQICACEEKPFSTNIRPRVFISCSLLQTLLEGVIRIKTRNEKYWPLLEYLRSVLHSILTNDLLYSVFSIMNCLARRKEMRNPMFFCGDAFRCFVGEFFLYNKV